MYLFATKDSLPLCLKFGFSILQPVFHFNGVVQADLSSTHSQNVQPIDNTDHIAIEQLDSAAMGMNRERIIKHLLSISKGNVIYEKAQLKAFALYRKFGRGHVIGPIVAETEEQAVALIGPIIETLSGQFVRIDTYLDSGYLVDYLEQANLFLHETATKMVRGKLPAPSGAARVLGLASQAFG